jgi:hypothetical protein
MPKHHYLADHQVRGAEVASTDEVMGAVRPGRRRRGVA